MQDQSTPGETDDSGTGQTSPPAGVTSSTGSLTQGFDASEFFKTYIETAKLIVLSPRVFFSQMPTSGGLKEPVTFFAVGLVANALLTGIFSFSFLSLVIAAVCPLIGLFAAAGLATGLSTAMGAKKPSFEAVARVYCYAGVVVAAVWVPYVGFLLGLYGLFLQFVGLKQVLKLDDVKTAGLCIVSGILAGVATGIATVMMVLKAALHL